MKALLKQIIALLDSTEANYLNREQYRELLEELQSEATIRLDAMDDDGLDDYSGDDNDGNY